MPDLSEWLPTDIELEEAMKHMEENPETDEQMLARIVDSIVNDIDDVLPMALEVPIVEGVK